jgi:small conductance mechanosensitive channel
MRLKFWVIAAAMVLAVWVMPPTQAQLPFLTNLQPPSFLSNDSDRKVVSGWIQLDGRRVFRIAAPKADFPERLQEIQQNLDQISQNYFQQPSTGLQVEVRESKGLPVIYVNNQYLLTITDQDQYGSVKHFQLGIW